MSARRAVAHWSIAAASLFILLGCGRAPGPQAPSGRAVLGKANGLASHYVVSYSAAEPVPHDTGQPFNPSSLDAETSSGQIVGMVTWSGSVPEPERITITKDTHVCAEHGEHDRLSELLVVNPADGGVRDTVISLVGKFGDAKPLSELPHPDTLNQRACSYDPRVFVLPLGARLALTSEDEIGHNVHMSGAFELNIAISKGVRSSRRMDQPGLVKVGCDIHPWMSAYIHIVKHPYYAVTDTSGKFELKDVPTGTHQIRLWHEAWWTENRKVADPIEVSELVTVRAGEATQVSFELSLGRD